MTGNQDQEDPPAAHIPNHGEGQGVPEGDDGVVVVGSPRIGYRVPVPILMIITGIILFAILYSVLVDIIGTYPFYALIIASIMVIGIQLYCYQNYSDRMLE